MGLNVAYLRNTLTLESEPAPEDRFVRVPANTYYGIAGTGRILSSKDIVDTCIVAYLSAQDTFGILANLHSAGLHHPGLALRMRDDLLGYARGKGREKDVKVIASVPDPNDPPQPVAELQLLFPFKDFFYLPVEARDFRRVAVYDIKDGACFFFRYALKQPVPQAMGKFDLKHDVETRLDVTADELRAFKDTLPEGDSNAPKPRAYEGPSLEELAGQ